MPWTCTPQTNTGGYKDCVESEDRDLVGYGLDSPSFTWPDGSVIALAFTVSPPLSEASVLATLTPIEQLNYEEGAEFTPWNGDTRSNEFLDELYYSRSPVPKRDLVTERCAPLPSHLSSARSSTEHVQWVRVRHPRRPASPAPALLRVRLADDHLGVRPLVRGDGLLAQASRRRGARDRVPWCVLERSRSSSVPDLAAPTQATAGAARPTWLALTRRPRVSGNPSNGCRQQQDVRTVRHPLPERVSGQI